MMFFKDSRILKLFFDKLLLYLVSTTLKKYPFFS